MTIIDSKFFDIQTCYSSVLTNVYIHRKSWKQLVTRKRFQSCNSIKSLVVCIIVYQHVLIISEVLMKLDMEQKIIGTRFSHNHLWLVLLLKYDHYSLCGEPEFMYWSIKLVSGALLARKGPNNFWFPMSVYESLQKFEKRWSGIYGRHEMLALYCNKLQYSKNLGP